jgi:membrane-associated phospholipid phosphatase
MKLPSDSRFASIYAYFTTQIKILEVWGLIFIVLALAVLSWLSWEVWEKETFFFDTPLLMRVHHWANPFFDQLMLSITQLGNPIGAITTSVIILGWLLGQKQFLEFGFFAIASLGAVLLNEGLKLIFTRPRPTLWQSLIQETTYSFPSGHALGSMVLYGCLAYLLAQSYPSRSPLIYGVASVIIIMIGLSRLYLGVHYPTDVIAGYIIGFLWLRICAALFKNYATKLHPVKDIKKI